MSSSLLSSTNRSNDFALPCKAGNISVKFPLVKPKQIPVGRYGEVADVMCYMLLLMLCYVVYKRDMHITDLYTVKLVAGCYYSDAKCYDIYIYIQAYKKKWGER